MRNHTAVQSERKTELFCGNRNFHLSLILTLRCATMMLSVTQFPCGYCDKTFSRKGHLNTHERTHTGDKPFSCSQCDYKCTTSSYLKQHERTHTGDKPFGCPHCDKKYIEKSKAKNHERIHTGYQIK